MKEDTITLTEAEIAFKEIEKEYVDGNISPSEYKDLLEGLEASNAITKTSDELFRKQELQRTIEKSIATISAIL
tara:strand:+ start:1448 stop:1669 length:222 start_codon:yes stop_codon:yes gene_type:complete